MSMIINKRPTYVEINLSNIVNNFNIINSHVGQNTKVLASLKANAYGHGIIEVANILQQNGCSWYGVAFIEEAIELRNAGIAGDILVLGGLYEGQIEEFLNYDITFTASSILKLNQINTIASKLGKIAKVHFMVTSA